MLRSGGIIVSTLTEPDKAKAAARHARGIHYMAQPDGAELREVARLIDEGQVMPTIQRVLPLASVAEAHRILEHGHVRGKIVLEVAP